MRLLIISYYFPPYNTVGAIRVGKNAKYLAAAGHNVRVVTARNPQYETQDTSLPVEIDPGKIVYTPWRSLSVPGKIVREIRRWSTPPATPAEHSGSRATYFEQPPAWLKLPYSVYVNLTHLPDAFIGWYRPAVRAALRLTQQWRPDMILASALPATAALVASAVSRKTGVPWVCELRDLWADNYYYPFWSLRRKVDSWLERRTLANARGLVTVSQPLAEILQRRYTCPITVVMNGYDPADAPPQPSPSIDGPLNIVYTGMIYPHKQDIGPLLLAIQQLGAEAQPVRLTMYMRSTPDPIRQQAHAMGIAHMIQFRSHVHYAKALELQRQADVLLLLLWNDPGQKGFYTAKIFEYLGARRPILAVGPADNVAGRLINDRQAGLTSDDPTAIASAIKTWLAQKQSGGIPVLPESVAQGLTRREQADRLAEFLSALSDTKTTG